MRLRHKPAAEADIREAFDYYENERSGLGSEFNDKLQRALELIGHLKREPNHGRDRDG